jgi:hypothetical protein
MQKKPILLFCQRQGFLILDHLFGITPNQTQESKMRRLFSVLTLALAISAVMALEFDRGFALCKTENGAAKQTAGQKVRIQIQVIADSSNSMHADLEVPVGTPARDLMDRLFKMSSADFSHKLVNGIAGFTANARDKKFWSLEIDGKASEVGIAEIKIDKPMQIRWMMAEFK